jgi:REP element-mobilizing transposase RayT
MDAFRRPPGSRALRRGRRTIAGQVYLLTTCTADREPWFGRHDVAQLAATICLDDDTWPKADPLLWLLMPDHWHGIVRISGDEPLGRTVARFKGRITTAVAQQTGYALWQSGFHDHALRSDERLPDVAAYVLDNPVRAGLVEHSADWPWQGGALASIEGL